MWEKSYCIQEAVTKPIKSRNGIIFTWNLFDSCVKSRLPGTCLSSVMAGLTYNRRLGSITSG